MKRFWRLIEDLWWLMLLLVATSAGLTYYVSPFFLVYLPIALIFFVYFAFVRYDAQGRDREK